MMERTTHHLRSLQTLAPWALALVFLFAGAGVTAADPYDKGAKDKEKAKPVKAEKASPPHSAHHDGDHDGAGRYNGLDRDGDGRISRSEWRGNDVSFSNHDWNGDGMLSGPEIQPGAQRDDDDDDDDLMTGRFDLLDENNDGRISTAEWLGHRDAFDRLDRNDDGFLSRAELDQPVLPATREQRFATLDVNRDGRLTTSEWRGGTEAFARLDANHDGAIARAEFLNPPTSLSRLELFFRWDHDDNGTLSRSEWHTDMTTFNRLDDDLDGTVSWQEYERG